MKQLIITSDDFGLSTGVNRAVEQAWRDGILTCASIMPGGAAFDDAVKIAKANPGLQVGLHLTLVQGNSVLPHDRIKELVTLGGQFSDNPVRSGFRYYIDRGLFTQLKREIEAQIVKVIDAGIPLTHVDGHLNIHMHPTIFRILAELMPRYGITSFRLSQERLSHNLAFDRTRRVGKTVERFIFSSLADYCRPILDKLGISYATEVKGVLNSGRMTEEYVLNILDGLQDGLTEMYFHPGILPDEEITRRMPDYRHTEELACITGSIIRQKLTSLGIELANYRGDRKNHA